MAAQERFDTYQLPEDEKYLKGFLLACSRDKLRVALDNSDLSRAAYVTGTSSWGIVEGLWAANNRILPPGSSVRPHLKDLTEPADIEVRFEELFLADTERRVRIALDLLEWIVDRLGYAH